MCIWHCIHIPTTLERKHSTKSISIINQKLQHRCERLTTFINFCMATSSIFWVPFSPYGRNDPRHFISHCVLLSLEDWPKFWETNIEPDTNVRRVEKRAEALSHFSVIYPHCHLLGIHHPIIPQTPLGPTYRAIGPLHLSNRKPPLCKISLLFKCLWLLLFKPEKSACMIISGLSK